MVVLIYGQLAQSNTIDGQEQPAHRRHRRDRSPSTRSRTAGSSPRSTPTSARSAVGSPLAALADAAGSGSTWRAPGSRSCPSIAGLLAGAAEVDITPPPGMPKAGHSRNARTGNGFRTRLRAHVLHLRAGTSSITLVQCDLLAGSAIVAQLVADAVSDLDVPLSGLLLGATHTHAGPGQFHGNALMNRFSSNHPGFDPAFTGWLVERIAGGRPRGRHHPPAGPAGRRRERGLGAHPKPLARPHMSATRTADVGTGAQAKYAAVNPWLHLIRVDGGTARRSPRAWCSRSTAPASRSATTPTTPTSGPISRASSPRMSSAAPAPAPSSARSRAPTATSRPPYDPACSSTRRPSGSAAASARRPPNSTTGSRATLSAEVELGVAFREVDLATASARRGDHAAPARRSAQRRWPAPTRTRHRSSTSIPPFRPGAPKPGAAARTGRNGSSAAGVGRIWSSHRRASRPCCPCSCCGSARCCWSGCRSR